MTEKEDILNKVAERMMHEWDINKFKLSHKRLFDVIMESMDEYAGQQVEKLNIDDVSKCPYCNSEYVNKTYNYCNSCEKHYN